MQQTLNDQTANHQYKGKALTSRSSVMHGMITNPLKASAVTANSAVSKAVTASFSVLRLCETPSPITVPTFAVILSALPRISAVKVQANIQNVRGNYVHR